MDKILHDLGGIVLNGLPTAVIVLVLAIFVKQLYLKPLEAVLAERHRLTEGARLAAAQSLNAADSRIAEYESALEKARGEIYAEQAEFLRNLNAEQAARAQAAKATSDSTLAAVRESLISDAAQARETLAAQSDRLASEIADAMLARRIV
jgi:F0F1-type ATP synthase membrane subunit b/b'